MICDVGPTLSQHWFNVSCWLVPCRETCKALTLLDCKNGADWCKVVHDRRTRNDILLQVTIYRWRRIDRDGHFVRSEAYDIVLLVRECEHCRRGRGRRVRSQIRQIKMCIVLVQHHSLYYLRPPSSDT